MKKGNVLIIITVITVVTLSTMILYIFTPLFFPDAIYQKFNSNSNQKEVLIYNRKGSGKFIYVAKYEDSYDKYDGNLTRR